MTFTDDDLKQVKEYCEVRRDLSHDVPVHPDIAFLGESVLALVARLEAAEHLVEHLHGPSAAPCCQIAEDLYQAWRKAAGK